MSANLQQVHIRVNDAATGKPTPCRMRFTDPEGNYYAPHGRLAKFATWNEDFGGNVLIDKNAHAYIDGTCEICLPAGRLHVEIEKGPEYQPLLSEVELALGKLSMRFTLQRWIDPRERGWYSGDTRALFLSPHAALLEGQAENLAVVNLLAMETFYFYGPADSEPVKAYPNLLAFSGQDFAVSVPGHGVAVNTLNQHGVLGALALLHCHRIVYPLRFGGFDGRENWTLADWCDQCHRKSGLVVWAEAAQKYDDSGYGETLADLCLGKIDAIELNRNDRWYEHEPVFWTRLFNAGLKATLVGASGKECNEQVLGSLRTYARLQPGESLTYKNWIEAVRAGRTFVTQGPILSFSVDGAEPSATTVRIQSSQPVKIHAKVQSWLPFARLAVWWNGEALETVSSGGGPPYHAAINIDRRFDSSGWLAACCFGQTRATDLVTDRDIIAVTSPVYLECDGPQARTTADAIRQLIGELDWRLGWVQDLAEYDSDKDRQRLADVFLQAKQVLLRKLDH